MAINTLKVAEPESELSFSTRPEADLVRPTKRTRRGQGKPLMRFEALLNIAIHSASTHTCSGTKAVGAGHQKASKTGKGFDRAGTYGEQTADQGENLLKLIGLRLKV